METINNLPWILYAIDTLTQSFSGLAIVTGLVTVLFIGTTALSFDDMCMKDGEAFRSKMPYKTLVCWLVFTTLWSTFVPDREDAHKYLAVWGGVELIQQPEIQSLGGKGIDVINKAMDEYLAEKED
jgi:hypothetical protein